MKFQMFTCIHNLKSNLLVGWNSKYFSIILFYETVIKSHDKISFPTSGGWAARQFINRGQQNNMELADNRNMTSFYFQN